MAALTYFTAIETILGVQSGDDVSADVTFEMFLLSGDMVPATGLDTPAGIVPNVVDAKIVDNVLYDVKANPRFDTPGVSLLANTNVLALASALQYRVTYSNVRVNDVLLPGGITGYTFAARTTSATLDLTGVARVPGIPGVGTAIGPQGPAGPAGATGATGATGLEWEPFANLAAFPGTGSASTEYVAQDTGKIYRWNGSAYVEVSVGEPLVTAGTTGQYYRGDKSFQTLNQDVVPDGTTNKAYSATDKAKLAGVSTGATANSSDAALLASAASAAASAGKSADTVTSGTTNKVYTATEQAKVALLSGTNTGDQTSVTGNAGTATALQTSHTIDGQAFNGTANVTVIAPGTAAATSKATPIDADSFPIVDSAASNVLARVTFANLKTWVSAYYNALVATMTNKRITKRVIPATSTATPTPTGDTADIWHLTTLTVTAAFAAPTGTPTDGQPLRVRVTSVAAQTLSWNAIYIVNGVTTLPLTSVAGKTITMDFQYDGLKVKWILMAVDAAGY